MNFQTIKQQIYQFLFTVMGFLLLVIVCAVVQGSLTLPLALALGVADLVGMNIVCGLASAKPAAQARRVPVRRDASLRRNVPLRVVRGGRAA